MFFYYCSLVKKIILMLIMKIIHYCFMTFLLHLQILFFLYKVLIFKLAPIIRLTLYKFFKGFKKLTDYFSNKKTKILCCHSIYILSIKVYTVNCNLLFVCWFIDIDKMSLVWRKLQRTNKKGKKYTISISPRELILDFIDNDKADRQHLKQVVIAFMHR